MDERKSRPGPLAEEKTSEHSPPGERQPEAAEVESARVLANRSRERLAREGFDDPTIERLADVYVSQDRGGDVDDFVDWAMAHRDAASHPDDPERTGEQSFPASDPPSTWPGRSGGPVAGS